MKKKLFTMTILAVVISMFTGCGAKKDSGDAKKVEVKPIEKVEVKNEEINVDLRVMEEHREQILNFVGPFDLTVRVTTNNDWQTAELMDNSGTIHKLEGAPVVSGVLLKNNNGVSIHLKGEEAVLILNNGNEINVKQFENVAQQEQTLNFVGPFDLTVRATTKDNWETAELMDNSGTIHKLERAPAASGVFLKNSNGVSIHMKGEEAVLILNNGNQINVKQFKN